MRRGWFRLRRTQWLIVLLLASIAVHVALLVVLPGDGSWVEAVYARRIYPVIGPVVAFVPSLLPFSLGTTVIVALLVWAPVYLVLNIVRWRRGRLGFWRAGERTLAGYVIVAAFLFHSFELFWGYNYLRPPLEERLDLTAADFSPELRSETARYIVGQAVATQVPVAEWDRAELDALVDAAMDRALRDLEGRGTPVVSPLKGGLTGHMLALQGSGGVVIPQSLEAHVDFGAPAHRLAFTAAHEKAHLAGFARERDANFVAWYALTRADDPRLRYAGYFGVVRYFLNAETRELALPLAADLAAVTNYRNSRVSEPVQRVHRRTYRVYLRANRMPAGFDDYSQVWQLIQAWQQLRE